MKHFFICSLLIILWGCQKHDKSTQHILSNSDGSIEVTFDLNQKRQPYYLLKYEGKIVLDTSRLGLKRTDGNFESQLSLVSVSEPENITDSYTMFHGKQRQMEYQAKQYTVHLKNDQDQEFNILFQLSENGVALKYQFPETSEDLKRIEEEFTSYKFGPETKSWLQPMAKAKTGWEQTNPSYEEHYEMAISPNKPSPIGEGWVYPALFKTDSVWALISETGLKENYCGSRLKYNEQFGALQVTFPQTEEVFPGGALNPESVTPWETPWRIITVGSLADIAESTLGTDLADPAIEMNTDFIKGGLSSWSWVLLKDDFTNYETSKKFIDYASNMNWDYCLIDCDWDQKIGFEKLAELASYAKSKDVKVLVWYNSAGSWNTTPYTPRSKLLTHVTRESEFKKLKDIGIAGVKIDFFGGDGQSMIAYYHDILKDAAAHELLVNFHGTTLPRGWQRTYPNLMTMESIKGEEFVTFEQVNADLQPSHCATIPFTRNVFDPMDFTPMVLDSIPRMHRRTSKAFELALPILFTSGVQHMAEIPEGMSKQPKEVIELLKNIPVDWDESKLLSGYPGKDVVMARRKGSTWFVVGINGENIPKTIPLDLSFTGSKTGTLFTDKQNNSFQIENVTSDQLKEIELNGYGGFVLKLD